MKKLKWEPACIICEKKDLFHSMQLRMNVLAKHEIPRSLLTAMPTSSTSAAHHKSLPTREMLSYLSSVF